MHRLPTTANIQTSGITDNYGLTGEGNNIKTRLVRLSDARNSDVLHFPKVESLAIGYIAGYLRANSFGVCIIDEEISELPRERTINELKGAEMIGFTAVAKPNILPIIETIRALKEAGCSAHITIGGQYPTFLHRQLLGLENVFDSIVRFEGEQTMLELAEAVESGKGLRGIKGLSFKEKGKILENQLRPLIDDLDSLPFPARDTLREVIASGGLPVISSSRGCYNRCSYCSISQFYSEAGGKPFRLRSAHNVLAELGALKETFPGIYEAWFVDDNFVMPGKSGEKRTLELCRGIRKLGIEFDIYLRAQDVNEKRMRALKESGLRNVFIGAEAGTDSTLQGIFNKNASVEQTLKAIKLCERCGIGVDPGFIMFHPWSTMDEISQNIKFFEKAGHYTLYGIASYLTPYKFTPIGKKMLSGEIPYRKSKSYKEDALNDFVPYEIGDVRTELLLCLTLKAFEEFRELPKLYSKMRQHIRELHTRGMKNESEALDKEWGRGVERMNKQGLVFFKELFQFMQNAKLCDGGIRPFFENYKERIRAFVDKEMQMLENEFPKKCALISA